MSTGPKLDSDARNECITAAYEKLGRPPTARQAAEESARDHNWFHPNGETWDDVLRDAGVPSYVDVVAEAIRDRFENRYPWQEFVVVRAGELADDLPLSAPHIGQKIGQLADGERSSPAFEGITICRCATGNGHIKWRVDADE